MKKDTIPLFTMLCDIVHLYSVLNYILTDIKKRNTWIAALIYDFQKNATQSFVYMLKIVHL